MSFVDKNRQFSLAFIFRQIFWIAILLALWRLFPKEYIGQGTVSDGMVTLFIQWPILIGVGAIVGALLGEFSGNAKKGAIIGVCISFVASTLWALSWLSAMTTAG